MSSDGVLSNLVLVRRSADGQVEWIPLESPAQHLAVVPDADYTLIDRSNYEAPQSLVAERVGKDLVVEVQGSAALVLEDFFTTADVAFYPTTNIAAGAGPFSGPTLTADSMAVADYSTGELVLWSADQGQHTEPEVVAASPAAVGAGSQAGGGSSPLLWGALAVGGLGLAALAGGGGGSGGGESGGSSGGTGTGGGTGGGGSTPDTTPPQFTSAATAAPIAENSGAGQVVYMATATDANTVTYSLAASGDAAAFSINATTGAVTLTANPDFETKPSYSFTVVATDVAGNHSERTVSLAINNVNDTGGGGGPPDTTPPHFTSGGTATPIAENAGAGQVVYTATATDANTVTYSLNPGGDADAFSINARTGAVTLIANPNFETKPSYVFTVVATDLAGNHSERAVSLAVTNLDEVAPTITSGGTAAPIQENSGPNQVVYTVTSVDTGDISTGKTAYSLASGGDSDAFTINPNTGAVTLVGNPDFETKSSYSFTVVATDAAHNSSQQAVTLQIIDVPEGPPPDTTPPTLSASTPADDARDVPVDQNIVLVFSENVQVGSGNITIMEKGDNRTIAVTDASQVSISGNQVTINPAADLNSDGNYNVRIDAGAFTDLAGNSFAGLQGADALHFRTANVGNLVLALDGGRAFQIDPTQAIDIRVDAAAPAAATADAAIWSGSTNLGSNDRVMLVSDAAHASEPSASPNSISIETAIAWQSEPNGLIEGSPSHSTHEAVPIAHDAMAHPQIEHMPVAIVTSQGLA